MRFASNNVPADLNVRTIAQDISAMFLDDGAMFKNANGDDLFEICQRKATRVWQDARYEFSDGSALIITQGWDIAANSGRLDCLCVESVSDPCEYCSRKGWNAIDRAAVTGEALCKHADPTEGARVALSIDEAREIAAEDPSLIYLEPKA